MAAELETQPPPPEPPITSVPETTEDTTAAPETTAQINVEFAGAPALAPKRQRRPSVRLGEIGDRRANSRRPKMPPWSWRVPKESSRTSKARSVTNLANGGEEFVNNRRGRAKRGSSMKRLRSDWAPRTVDENGSERFREFDHDHNNHHDHGHDLDLDHDRNSPAHSVDENGHDYWQVDRNDDQRVRVSENEGVESESREQRKNEGVRSWLFELGLSRYAPIFEIHEVDDELLPMLTLEDLKDMGISAVGSRRKMYTAIQKLRKGFP